MPRSAFLEGAREAGGTKTYSGAIVKQKTAVPQGAASLSLAVLESDGRKREVAIDDAVKWKWRMRRAEVEWYFAEGWSLPRPGITRSGVPRVR